MIDKSNDNFVIIDHDYQDTFCVQIIGSNSPEIYFDLYDSVEEVKEGKEPKTIFLKMAELNEALEHFGYEIVRR